MYNENEVYLLWEEMWRMRELPHEEAQKEKIKEKAKIKWYLIDWTPIYLYDKERLVIDNLVREVIYEDSYKKSSFWFWFFIWFLIFIIFSVFIFGIIKISEKKQEVKTPQTQAVKTEEIPKTLISKIETELEEEEKEEPQVQAVLQEENIQKEDVVQEFILAQEYEKIKYLFDEKKEELEICGQELNNQALYIQALKNENEELKNKTLDVDTFTAFLWEKIWEKCEKTEDKKVKETCEKLSALFLKTQKDD